MKKFALFLTVILVMLAVSAVLSVNKIKAPIPDKRISNFEECVAAGNPATLSYPAQCRTADGQVFTQSVPPKNSLPENDSKNQVSNFEQCKAAGNPIMESFPEQCMTPSGKSFTRELTDEEKKNLQPPSDIPSKGEGICRNTCGNGKCEKIVCLGEGCPCPETPESCQQDCKPNDQSSMAVPEGWMLN